MVIAVDLDGVVFDSENYYRTYAHIYDLEVVKSGTYDKQELNMFARHNWNKDNANEFYELYTQKVLEQAPIKPGAKYVLTKLKEMGHKLVCITLRGYYRECEIDITEDRLKEAGIEFDKIIYCADDKYNYCKKEGVSVIIEDNHSTLEKLSDKGIIGLHFRGAGLKKVEKENVYEIQDWADVLEYFLQEKNKK